MQERTFLRRESYNCCNTSSRSKNGDFVAFCSHKSTRCCDRAFPIPSLRQKRTFENNSGNEVPYPSKGTAANYPKNTDDKQQNIALGCALNDSVNCPHDIEEGKTEQNLNDPGKIVKPRNHTVLSHNFSLLK